ncbi:MAG: PhzF family phenazine biosynthesis protein [Woeseiaceae bacterium]|nr:PhzF family phenazine biosynthesis protein [Woeseiaceae bacterium]
MQQGTLYRLAAFTRDPAGGNPAGVWVGDILPEGAQMRRIASGVGYSETAFIAPATGHEREIRYFSPEAEVTFCGHATIASGVVLGRAGGEGVYRLQTTVGEVPVTVRTQDGRLETALVSVATRHEAVPDALLHEALAALDWQAGELATEIPPVRAYAGAWHLVLAAATRARLASLDYDFERLKALMLAENLTTLQLIWRESKTVFHARNPFPVGGVVEDPATGAAAAALGGYLRDAGLVKAPHSFVVRQGEDMGRPSLLHVEVPENGGIVVSGTAVDL